ncbi:MAG: hypothetical protein LC623_06105 [Halobacteriales archaeon]|nr:hypothetical protein [Halobacteriales archaeon]
MKLRRLCGAACSPTTRQGDAWGRSPRAAGTWYYDGYLFTGDLARGMDVLAFR